MKKILKVLYYAVVVCILLLAATLVLPLIPISGNIKIMTVRSGSMEPTISTGSVVVVRPTSTYAVNDIITFGPVSKTKSPTTHRIIEVKQYSGYEAYITQGDANNGPDIREVVKRDVIGKVLFHVPYVGFVIAAVQKPIGFATVVGIPALFILVEEIKNIAVEIKKKAAARANVEHKDEEG
jgi:signal peptidase